MNENAYVQTMNILKKYNIYANKSLGQNFLINDDVIEKIIDIAEVSKNDLIIEIGPGLGTLTSHLIERANKVIAIELDKRMIQILQDRFNQFSNFQIINEDVLKVDINRLILEESNNINKIKIVANLPYYITTPIIMKLLEEKLNIESITVMVQKEVAQRLTANPGEKFSGAITYAVNYYCEAQNKLIVPSSSFIPEPEVESAVIKLILREKPDVNLKDEKLFFKLIKAAFLQRRKTLVNALSNAGIADKEKIKQILEKNGLDEKTRGEQLTMAQFANLSNDLK